MPLRLILQHNAVRAVLISELFLAKEHARRSYKLYAVHRYDKMFIHNGNTVLMTLTVQDPCKCLSLLFSVYDQVKGENKHQLKQVHNVTGRSIENPPPQGPIFKSSIGISNVTTGGYEPTVNNTFSERYYCFDHCDGIRFSS